MQAACSTTKFSINSQPSTDPPIHPATQPATPLFHHHLRFLSRGIGRDEDENTTRGIYVCMYVGYRKHHSSFPGVGVRKTAILIHHIYIYIYIQLATHNKLDFLSIIPSHYPGPTNNELLLHIARKHLSTIADGQTRPTNLPRKIES